MFIIPLDICEKLIEECEKYQFHDVNKLSQYKIFSHVVSFKLFKYSSSMQLNFCKKIIMYLFGTLNGNIITLDEPINAFIPEKIDDYSLGSFKKFDQHGRNNNFCINCVDCENCTSCVGCTGCKKCKNCYSCTKCYDCIKCEECKNCIDCFDCEICNDCELCSDCFDCKCLRLCFDCHDCFDCKFCNNCVKCNMCLGCKNDKHKEYVDQLD